MKEYSEDNLVEQPAIDLFKELEWETAFAYHSEDFGEDSKFGRANDSELILKRYLRQALKDFNPNLPARAYEIAIQHIEQSNSYQSLAEINKDKYNLFLNGVSVDYKDDKGKLITNKKLRVFDFTNYKNNHFIAIQQLWVQGRIYRRRPDVIGFVNGIPLLFIELKAAHRNLRKAYDENLSDYKDTIPELFHHNAFIILSNGIKSKIGSITSKYQYFNEWKRISNEEEEGVVSMETILRGVCEKHRFMDLFENFVLFDDGGGKLAKIIARNHQFLGVNNAMNSVDNIKDLAGRLGVFWHTQGSGKSYSMVFFARKVHRKKEGTYTFVIITDRQELDRQIYGTFADVGAVAKVAGGKKSPVQAKSGKHLKKLLQSNERYLFTLIHKFHVEKGQQYEMISERDDIIVISDEAHRTQGGTYALNMRNAIPNASFIGFTGTPLFTHDELTKKIFGEYISIYDFKRSVIDGATVPLFYENRGELLKLKNAKITKQMRKKIEEAELDQNQSAKLERLFAKEYPVLTAEKRLKSIAKDLVWHFNNRGNKGKAMLVCIDKVTAVRMYEYIDKYWKEYIRSFKKSIAEKAQDEQEEKAMLREWRWMKETEYAVVVSSEQNEVKKFKKWGLDIEKHRLKMKERDLEAEFKEEENPFRLSIVCAMWLTGFDVPSLSTLYIDKPLHAHTLMQAIARANRVYEGKNNGEIVDYIDGYKSLLKALGQFAIRPEGGGGTDIEPEDLVLPIEELASELEEVLQTVETYLNKELDFDINTIIKAKDKLHKLAAIEKGANAVCKNDPIRKQFTILAREVFTKFKAIIHKPAIANPFRTRRDAIDVIYKYLEDQKEKADVTDILIQLQKVVDKSIKTVKEDTPVYHAKFVDLSNLDFDAIKKVFATSTKKNIDTQTLKQRIEKKLAQMLAKNKERVDFYKRYQQIILEYNSGKSTVTIEQTFFDLLAFSESLAEEEQRIIREGLTEEQGAVFDILRKEKQLTPAEKKKVKAAAVELLTVLEAEKFKIDNWEEKEEIASSVHRIINEHLFQKLPFPLYQNEDVATKTELTFLHVKHHHGGGSRAVI